MLSKRKMVKNIFSIKNKIIIITGAGRGIGKTIACAMVDRGAIVYCFDISQDNELKGDQNNIYYAQVDITDESLVRKECERIFSKHKRIDVLINNAGVSFTINDGEDYPLDLWEKTFNVNLTGALKCSQIIKDYMKIGNSGSIINITSLNAEQAFMRNAAYVASKGGLKMLGKSMARDWGKYGIRVNNLGPGYILTEMTKISYDDSEKRNKRTERTMLGRWGVVGDLIGPCIFLASDASSYVTGQDIYVDGGWLSKGL